MCDRGHPCSPHAWAFEGCTKGPGWHQQCQRSRSIHRLWCLGVNVAQAQRCLILVCWGTLILDPWCRCSLVLVALPVLSLSVLSLSVCPCLSCPYLSLCCHHLPTAILSSDMHFLQGARDVGAAGWAAGRGGSGTAVLAAALGIPVPWAVPLLLCTDPITEEVAQVHLRGLAAPGTLPAI